MFVHPLIALERHEIALDPGLVARVRHELIGAAGDGFRSGYLLAVGRPPSTEDGPFAEVPHLDSHPELTESTELLRLLVNLSRHPRRFLYALTDRRRLAHPRRTFQPLRLPPGVETRVGVLPGRTDTTLHALRFLASAVPHVGLNDPPEHFLLSFEAITPHHR